MMIPVVPRQVVLLSGPAYRPAPYRPAPYRPTALGRVEARPVLGEGPSLNWRNIGTTIMFAAGGAGAMYAAPLFPDPVKTLSMVAGVGLIGYAAYSLLGKSESADEKNKNKSFKAATPADFAAITGKILSPLPGSKESWNLLSNTYNVVAQVHNPSRDAEVSARFQLVAQEAPWWTYLVGSPSEPYVADYQTVTIKPTGVEPIQFTPSVKTSRWLSQNETITLLLQKVDENGNAVTLAKTDVVVGYA